MKSSENFQKCQKKIQKIQNVKNISKKMGKNLNYQKLFLEKIKIKIVIIFIEVQNKKE